MPWEPFRRRSRFLDTITDLTGARVFAYRIAVTRLQGDSDVDRWAREWSEDPTIKPNLDGCSSGFLTLEEMWGTLLAELKKTPASSENGRLAQLLKAAGMTAPTVMAPPEPPLPGSDAALEEEQEQGQ